MRAEKDLVRGNQTAKLPWPQGWHRSRVPGWLKITLLSPLPLAMVPGGLVAAANGSVSTENRIIGATVALFGLALVLLPLSATRPRRTVNAHTVIEPATGERGLMIPYAQKRLGATTVALIIMTIGSLVPGTYLVRTALETSRDVWWPMTLCLFMAGAFGWAAGFGFDRIRRPWMIALTPSNVSLRLGRGTTVLPWSHIESVEACEFAAGSAFYKYREPYAALLAPPGSARVVGSVPRRFRKIIERFGGELDLPLRMVAIDPVVVLYALEYYHAHPGDRAELETGAAVERVRGRGLVPTGTRQPDFQRTEIPGGPGSGR